MNFTFIVIHQFQIYWIINFYILFLLTRSYFPQRNLIYLFNFEFKLQLKITISIKLFKFGQIKFNLEKRLLQSMNSQNLGNQIQSLKIMIAGGDGFIGWPLSLRLSNLGHQVLIVDNLSRRQIDSENGYCSVTPIASIQQRLQKWKELTGKTITFAKIDIAHQQPEFQATFQAFRPDVVVHLAQQRAAPYSMKSIQTIDYTFTNNTQSTKNILVAIMKFNKSCHMVHLGTMGVYGYGAVEGSTIPQGYCMAKLNCQHVEKCDCIPVEIVHPYYPGSVYHMTKCLDNVTLLNFHKYFGLKITELHQGIVWGISTPETQIHKVLVNRVDVDSDYGTVLNRFCAQVANDYPMTIYGTGGQTRSFINIKDSIKCITLAIEYGCRNQNFSKVQILNQITETISLNELANMLLRLYPQSKCEYIQNPRVQKSQNTLNAKNQKFKKLGHEGIRVNEEDIMSLVQVCKKNKQRFEMNLPYIKPISFWTK